MNRNLTTISIQVKNNLETGGWFSILTSQSYNHHVLEIKLGSWEGIECLHKDINRLTVRWSDLNLSLFLRTSKVYFVLFNKNSFKELKIFKMNVLVVSNRLQVYNDCTDKNSVSLKLK